MDSLVVAVQGIMINKPKDRQNNSEILEFFFPERFCRGLTIQGWRHLEVKDAHIVLCTFIFLFQSMTFASWTVKKKLDAFELFLPLEV